MTAYASVVELKQQIGKELASDNTVLDFLLQKASETIDRICNVREGFFLADETASARDYAGSGRSFLWIDDTVEITNVAVKDSPSDAAFVDWDAADWRAASGDPSRPNFNSTPYAFLIALSSGGYSIFNTSASHNRPGFRPLSLEGAVYGPTVRVTARWGYSDVVPGPIEQAAIIQASRWYKRGQGVWGDTLANAQMGQLTFMKKLDPDLELILSNGRFLGPMVKRR